VNKIVGKYPVHHYFLFKNFIAAWKIAPERPICTVCRVYVVREFHASEPSVDNDVFSNWLLLIPSNRGPQRLSGG